MTLRMRIAAVASLSVALAVLAAAIGLYVAVSSDLRGEIDTQLRTRARVFAGPGGPPRVFRFGKPPSGTAPFGVPGTGGRTRVPGRVQPAPFGGASGYVEFIASDGRVFVPGGQRAPGEIAVTATDRRIAAAGHGSRLSDRSVKGTHLRVLTVATGDGSAVVIARPLTEVEHELSHLLLILVLIGAAGILLAALLGA